MTQTPTEATRRFTVAGKDRLSDAWVAFTGNRDECQLWAARRAFVVRAADGEPELTPIG